MSGFVGVAIAIIGREFLRFVHQRERFIAALVRPLAWLLIFAAGFRATLGLSIIAPYQTYITYETYFVPGLCAGVIPVSYIHLTLPPNFSGTVTSVAVLIS